MSISPVATLCNGVQMPRVGFGTWQLKGKECVDSVLHALQIGCKLIDTASAYNNEEQVKEALDLYSQGKKASSYPPVVDELKIETGNSYGIFVTSKAKPSEIGLEATYKACHNSLQRLGIPKLDLYLLHWPGAEGVAVDSAENRQIRRQAWMAMEKLYNEGKVRAIGVSNYLVKHLNELIEDGVNIKPMVNQLEYHPLCQNEDVIKWANENKMQLQAYSSLGIGNTRLLDNPIIMGVSKEVNKTAAQVLLRWGLQKNLCVIPRSKTKSRIVENFDIMNFELNDTQMDKVTAITEKSRFCWDPNTIM